jgi:Tol biopolymer transport system component
MTAPARIAADSAPRGLRVAPALAVTTAALAASALGVVLAVFVLAAASARADVFGPISLVSAGSVDGAEAQQAEYAHDPAISGDGRYVAFDGSIGGVGGVWRRDLATGAIEQVAGGDAELPSISENGRYISFTTNEGANLSAITNGLPDTSPKPEAVDVYVRDMAVPAGASCSPTAAAPLEECAFTVVSAPSGSRAPLTYAPSSESAATRTGSAATGRSAIDAAGDEVAFVTTATSDLTDPQTPTEPKTPALQVAVRYLREDRTRLVSGRYEPATASTTEEPVLGTEKGSTATYGAVYPGDAVSFGVPPAYGAYESEPPPGASLSADGTTVAWMGEDIGEQAPLLAEESQAPLYTEPLWRRIAPGAETPTERVTGGSEPLNPACVASGETVLPQAPSSTDPCQGPFAVAEGQPSGILANAGKALFVPRLSADGFTVAFVSNAPLVALGSDFGRGRSGQASDLYVADMRPGLTREQALTQITELAGGEAAGLEDTASIADFGISPDGTQVAFTTRRTQFPLGFPAYVSAPAAEAGMSEVFDADLGNGTLTRVTQGYEGGPGEHPHLTRPAGQDPYEEADDGGLSPSFSTNGDLLAFSSTAANLVWGDGNTPPAQVDKVSGSADGADAFLVERRQFGVLPTLSEISPRPAGPALAPAPSLSATAVSLPDGEVRLYVEVPGAGALRAAASSAVLVGTGAARPHTARKGHRQSARRGARRGAHSARAARARRRPPGRGPDPRAALLARTVAASTVPVHAPTVVTVTLALAKPYARLAAQRGGLSATANLTFVGAIDKRVLRQSIAIVFARTAASRSAHHARAGGRR